MTIVVPAAATEGEKLAAKDLATLLESATGSAFDIVTDDSPASRREIRIGNTNRSSINAVPERLRPRGAEGFTIFVDHGNISIYGNTTRATVYGVYDLLEQEGGLRFLTTDFTYIPNLRDQAIDVESRTFTPTFEYRNVHIGTDDWCVRNKLNARWSDVPRESILGGVRFIGPGFGHTAGLLVPSEKYFADHPEYYALVDGQRRKTQGNTIGGLCFSNPDVARIATDTVRQWVADYRAAGTSHSESMLIASISNNDDGRFGWCQCPRCKAINDREGSESGALMTFVNAVASTLSTEFPNLRFDTLAYTRSLVPPKHLKLENNVNIRFAPIDSDYLKTFDDPTSPENKITFESMSGWSQLTDHIYIWNYHTSYHAYLKPFPDLRVLGPNIRLLRDMHARGYYAQTAQTTSAAFEELRNYVLARCLWRPDTDVDATIQEFCSLYYGAAAGEVLQYINMIHDNAKEQKRKLGVFDASNPAGLNFSYDFLSKCDDVLSAAENAASTADEKRRVAIVRLSPWYMMLEKAIAGQLGAETIMTLPVEWKFRTDPLDVGGSENWFVPGASDQWQTMRTDNHWNNQGLDYHGIAWYSTEFTVAQSADKKISAIQFGAIDGEHHRIYVDGVLVDERRVNPATDWNQPFSVPLKSPLLAGKHTLVISTRKMEYNGGIWRPVALMGENQGLPDRVRQAGKRFMEVSKQVNLSHMSEFYGRPGEQVELYNRRIEALLNQPIAGSADAPRGIRKAASLTDNIHHTYTTIKDEKAVTGSCTRQEANVTWTLNQSTRWDGVDALIKKAQEEGKIIVPRVRVRVDQKGKAGSAFKFGLGIQHGADRGWTADVVADREIMSAQIPGNGWRWYELSGPITSRRGQPLPTFFYVLPANNAANIGAVYVDAFELTVVNPR